MAPLSPNMALPLTKILFFIFIFLNYSKFGQCYFQLADNLILTIILLRKYTYMANELYTWYT